MPVVFPPGDMDGNSHVDLSDHAALADCLGGPDIQPTPTPPTTWPQCLAVFDFNDDFDVDLFDFEAFQRAFTGE